MSTIKGLFEIHITIDHTIGTALHDLITFTLPRVDLKRTAAINPKGTWPNQYMITKWSHGTEEEVTARAMKLADEVRTHGLVTKRVKVESVASNDGVREVCAERAATTYFEFHAKMALQGKAYFALDADVQTIGRGMDACTVGVSFNMTGRTGAPIVDLRVTADKGRDFAVGQKDILIEGLKGLGYDVIGTLQSEYVVYDDNKDLDEGWM
jgi:hypothetical protein